MRDCCDNPDRRLLHSCLPSAVQEKRLTRRRQARRGQTDIVYPLSSNTGFPPEPVLSLSFNPKTLTFISESSYVAATCGAVAVVQSATLSLQKVVTTVLCKLAMLTTATTEAAILLFQPVTGLSTTLIPCTSLFIVRTVE